MAVALISESEGWTIGAIVIANILFQLFLFYISNGSPMANTIEGSIAIWSPFTIVLLIALFIVAFIILGLTFVIQARKTDFI